MYFLCLCVRESVCVYVCVYVFFACVSEYGCECVCVCVCVRARARVCERVCLITTNPQVVKGGGGRRFLYGHHALNENRETRHR
jgi:hypothetical protein